MPKLTALAFALVLAVLPQGAAAQDLTQYNRALSAFNAGDYDRAATTFFELTENATDADVRQKSEYYLAQSFLKKDMPFSAFVYFGPIVAAGKAHPFYLKGVEGLINVQQQLDDQEFIPRLINRHYSDDWATLPLEVLSRINYLIGNISYRQAKFEDAKSFLEAVPRESLVYSKAQYLLGVALADARYPGGPQNDAAAKAFEEVVNLLDPRQVDKVQTQHLAMLGLGRLYYGAGDYRLATQWYERIPRFSQYWNVALFENGFARFQNEDFGGALGSLQALHAPQFAGAFEPESWILKATVYYFSCLYDEADRALQEFDVLYLPMQEKLKAALGGDKDEAAYFKLVQDADGNALPRPVLNWVRGNERVLSLFKLLSQIDAEKASLSSNPAWRGSKLVATLTDNLDQNRNLSMRTAGLLAKNRLILANRTIELHAGNAEIIRFETSKGGMQLVEAGINQDRLLAEQKLFRPKMPAEDWNYWKFQGEFWIDEIGYYQYTLKRGCPAGQAE